MAESPIYLAGLTVALVVTVSIKSEKGTSESRFATIITSSVSMTDIMNIMQRNWAMGPKYDIV